jgi:hypothetical protein
MILLQKEWFYTLELLSEQYILSIVCGSIGIYDVKIQLNSEEIKQFNDKGEVFIEQLAEAVRFSPTLFKTRYLD